MVAASIMPRYMNNRVPPVTTTIGDSNDSRLRNAAAVESNCKAGVTAAHYAPRVAGTSSGATTVSPRAIGNTTTARTPVRTRSILRRAAWSACAAEKNGGLTCVTSDVILSRGCEATDIVIAYAPSGPLPRNRPTMRPSALIWTHHTSRVTQRCQLTFRTDDTSGVSFGQSSRQGRPATVKAVATMLPSTVPITSVQ